MLAEDIRLAKELYDLVEKQPELEAFTNSLSITTFRYVPSDLKSESEQHEEYLNQLNTELPTRLQNSGEAYISNAVIDGKFALRPCIVNFRTSVEDVEALPGIVLRIGREVDAELRPEERKVKG
jgi:glutamate/tyrosine decarboxylase-like PLP-dependent enzyme